MKGGEAVLISEKEDLRTRKNITDKEGSYIMVG